MKIRNILLVLVITVINTVAMAQQQSQFTQFMNGKLLLNPAYSGVSGNINASLLGRWQWVGFEGAPNTQALIADARIPNKNIGVGLVISRDEEAVNRSTNIQLNYAYHIPLWEGTLSMGLSGSLNSFSANFSEAFVLDADPTFAQNSTSLFPNFGAGLYYERSNFWASVSLPTLINNTLTEGDLDLYQQKRHFYAMGGYRYDLSASVRLEPNVLFKVVDGSPLSVDMNVTAWFNDTFATGLSYRNRESVNFILQIQANEQLRFGYAIDYVTNAQLSNLANTSHEVLVSYSIPWVTREKGN